MSAAWHRLSIAELSAGLHGGKITVPALTAAMLERAVALNPALRAFVEIWETGGFLRAAQLNRHGPKAGQPLWGIPLAHKDLFAREYRQPGCGVIGPTGGDKLPASPAIAACDAAGSVDLGPLTLAEFASGITGTNAFYGDAGNPWDLARCSGASSSGSAVAVAAGLVAGSLGTDTGASVRLPASFCGVVGLKPTAGAIDTTGVFPSSWTIDAVGPLARTVEDCALLFDVARGAAPQPVAEGGTLRIGIPDSYYTDHTVPEVAEAWQTAQRVLERAGHRVRAIPVVETEGIRALMRTIMRSEGSAVHRGLMQRFPGNYALPVRKFVSGGEGVLAVDYIDALRLRGALLREALAETFDWVDALLVPTVPVLPPRYDALADARDSTSWRNVLLLAHHTQPASYLGLPALSVPVTLSTDGTPIGMQLIGAPWAESVLFRAALPLQRHWRGLDLWPGAAP